MRISWFQRWCVGFVYPWWNDSPKFDVSSNFEWQKKHTHTPNKTCIFIHGWKNGNNSPTNHRETTSYVVKKEKEGFNFFAPFFFGFWVFVKNWLFTSRRLPQTSRYCGGIYCCRGGWWEEHWSRQSLRERQVGRGQWNGKQINGCEWVKPGSLKHGKGGIGDFSNHPRTARTISGI